MKCLVRDFWVLLGEPQPTILEHVLHSKYYFTPEVDMLYPHLKDLFLSHICKEIKSTIKYNYK